ncbi:MAG: hypothetical protein AAGM45_22460 [Cyanobacteria bacterium J06588_5]
MKRTALEMRISYTQPFTRLSTQASTQLVGPLETDVFCIFLGRVWKMRTACFSVEETAETAVEEQQNITPETKTVHQPKRNLNTTQHTKEDEIICRH